MNTLVETIGRQWPPVDNSTVPCASRLNYANNDGLAVVVAVVLPTTSRFLIALIIIHILH